MDKVSGTVRVWKYPLGLGVQDVEMHENAHVIRVDYDPRDRTRGAFWAVVDTTAPIIKRVFLVVFTGQAFPPSDSDARLQDKVIIPMGGYNTDKGLAYHVFELVPIHPDCVEHGVHPAMGQPPMGGKPS